MSEIDEKSFELLIDQFDLGTSTAEQDPLLISAQIKTQEFWDLLSRDRIDIIRGIKGAGKTALFKIISALKEDLQLEKRLYCFFGVEASGDPVFKHFKESLDKFDEIDFENFWAVYFLALIRKKIKSDTDFASELFGNDDEAQDLERLFDKLGVPESTGGILETVKAAIANIMPTKLGAGVGVTPRADGSTSFKPEVTLELAKNIVVKSPKYLGEIKETLCALLKKRNLKIWILLDRLDEVFPRRTAIETRGLKGLMKVSYNLSQPELRVKVFLRDDIINQLANVDEGFTALTHVLDRASQPLRWEPQKLLYLVVKRLFPARSFIASYYKIDQSKMDDSSEYQIECFYKVFTSKMGKQTTFEWILSMLRDGNNLVTPRDLIDYFNLAKSIEYRKFVLKKGPREFLISGESFREAFDEYAREKKDKYLIAEFPHMKAMFMKFEGGYSIHNAHSLQNILGDNWQNLIHDLVSIGFIQHDPKKAQYRIPRIWVKALRITQGKAFEKKVKT